MNFTRWRGLYATLAITVILLGCVSTPPKKSISMTLSPQAINNKSCRAHPDFANYAIKKIAVLDFADSKVKPTTSYVPLKKFGLRNFENHIYLEDSGNHASASAERTLLESYLYKLVERRRLSTLLKEQKLALSGIIDANDVKEVGKISGADALLSGSVQEAYSLFTKNTRTDGSFIGTYISYVTLDIRLLDVKSGDILLACTTHRNSLNYLEKPVLVTNLAFIKDAHLLDIPLHGATPNERVRYVLSKAVEETLAAIIPPAGH